MSHIASLRLTDFRSYASLDIALSGAPVVLYGPNGAGKTNLLEAVSFLSPGRGLRRAKMEDLARRSGEAIATAWGINAQVGETRASVGQVPEYPKRRIVRMDGKNASGTQLAQLLTLMWLTPAQDRLFTGPASDRRKFMDRFSLVHAPSHGMASLRYEKARSERNRLLSDGIMDKGWYEALEADMATQGAHVAQARALTVTRLIEEIETRAAAKDDDVFPKAIVALEGEAEEQFQSGLSFEDVESYIRERLAADRPLDQRAGRTLRGVHKSDLCVRHAEKNMPAADCSTGEQKALLIGLSLAHARAQSDKKPILLLDEVAAHLDIDRRAALIEELIALGTQIFMTGTDASLFEAFNGRAQMFEVRDGSILEKTNP